MGSKRKRAAKEGQQNEPKIAKKAKPSTSTVAPEATILQKAPFVDSPIGDERKREGSLYELLGSEDESERIGAAECIISSLLDGEGSPEAAVQRHLDRRLFRGLASSRNASRLGFSLVITELLSQLYGPKGLAKSRYPGLTFDRVLSFLVEKVDTIGNIPGQQERDQYFGQLFGIECYVRANILFQDLSRWNAVLALLLELGNRKIWLRSQCGWVIVQAVSQMNKEQLAATLHRVSEANLAKTPEGVAIWLVAGQKCPQLQVKPWPNGPLARKTLGDLAAILKESLQETNSSEKAPYGPPQMNRQANWTAQLHFVWDNILSYFGQQKQTESVDFENFWQRVVDDGLFSKNATDGQKFKGFTVFQKVLEEAIGDNARLPTLFSKNLMTCLMNQAAKEDRYLHRAATKALKAVENCVGNFPNSLAPILESLLGKNGAYSFDQRTSTRTVEKLLLSMKPKNEKEVMKILQRPLANLGSKEAAEAQAVIRTYIEYLSKSLNAIGAATSQENETQDTGRGEALAELSRIAYSQPNHIPQELLTEKIRELCRTRLESCLAKLTRRSEDFNVFCDAVAAIDSSSIKMDATICDAASDALARMRKLLKKKNKKPGEASLARGLAVLHAVSIFQLYNEDADAMEVLNDLAQFSEKFKTGVSEEGMSELLVEILLSMVARPSSLMRQISQQVFETFSNQVSAEGLELLTRPLAAGESAQGQKELFNTEEDDDVDMDQDDGSDDEGDDDEEVVDVEDLSDFEMESGVEFTGLVREGLDDEDDDNDEDEHDDVDDEEEEEDSEAEEADEADDVKAKEMEDLDNLLGKILDSHRLDQDGDAESSSDDGDMSDSDMLALDDKLTEVFKQRAKARPDTKKQKKDAKQSVVNFKHRILDLLDIYVKKEALNQLTLTLLGPLLHLMRNTSTKPLANRACEIILTYQKGIKKARTNKDNSTSAVQPDADNDKEDGDDNDDGSENDAKTSDDLLSLLAEVHEDAGKDNAHAYAKAASAASLIVASIMFTANKDNIKRVAVVYAKTQSDWVLGKAKLQNSFFADWNNWCQNHASQAAQKEKSL